MRSVIKCVPIEGILQEGVQVFIEARRYQLYLSTLDSHHKRGHPRIRYGVFIDIFYLDQDFEIIHLACTTNVV